LEAASLALLQAYARDDFAAQHVLLGRITSLLLLLPSAGASSAAFLFPSPPPPLGATAGSASAPPRGMSSEQVALLQQQREAVASASTAAAIASRIGTVLEMAQAAATAAFVTDMHADVVLGDAALAGGGGDVGGGGAAFGGLIGSPGAVEAQLTSRAAGCALPTATAARLRLPAALVGAATAIGAALPAAELPAPAANSAVLTITFGGHAYMDAPLLGADEDATVPLYAVLRRDGGAVDVRRVDAKGAALQRLRAEAARVEEAKRAALAHAVVHGATDCPSRAATERVERDFAALVAEFDAIVGPLLAPFHGFYRQRHAEAMGVPMAAGADGAVPSVAQPQQPATVHIALCVDPILQGLPWEVLPFFTSGAIVPAAPAAIAGGASASNPNTPRGDQQRAGDAGAVEVPTINLGSKKAAAAAGGPSGGANTVAATSLFKSVARDLSAFAATGRGGFSASAHGNVASGAAAGASASAGASSGSGGKAAEKASAAAAVAVTAPSGHLTVPSVFGIADAPGDGAFDVTTDADLRPKGLLWRPTSAAVAWHGAAAGPTTGQGLAAVRAVAEGAALNRRNQQLFAETASVSVLGAGAAAAVAVPPLVLMHTASTRFALTVPLAALLSTGDTLAHVASAVLLDGGTTAASAARDDAAAVRRPPALHYTLQPHHVAMLLRARGVASCALGVGSVAPLVSGAVARAVSQNVNWGAVLASGSPSAVPSSGSQPQQGGRSTSTPGAVSGAPGRTPAEVLHTVLRGGPGGVTPAVPSTRSGTAGKAPLSGSRSASLGAGGVAGTRGGGQQLSQGAKGDQLCEVLVDPADGGPPRLSDLAAFAVWGL
jgi:hypothetical protein